MGSDNEAVLDVELRVRGVDGLRGSSTVGRDLPQRDPRKHERPHDRDRRARRGPDRPRRRRARCTAGRGASGRPAVSVRANARAQRGWHSHLPRPGRGALCEAFQRTAALNADYIVALRTPDDAVVITWEQYAARVQRIAAGLAAVGVGGGDTVGLMLVNRPEFNLVDTAALHLGATPFSIYNGSTAQQIAYLLENASNRIVITEHQFLRVIGEAVRAAGRIIDVVLVDGEHRSTVSLAELERMGDPMFEYEATWRDVVPQDIATIIYTCAASGPPKGVQLTHAGLIAQVRAMHERLPVTPGGRAISFLPSAHIADRWSHHYHASIGLGFTVTCLADPRTIAAQLPEVRPTMWGSVPGVWEKIKASLEANGITAPAALGEARAARSGGRSGWTSASR